MPEIASRTSAPQRRSVLVPGIFEAWVYCNASWRAMPDWHHLDGLDDHDYGDALDAARDRAEVAAAERIGDGQAIIGKLLRAGHRMITPWTEDRDSFTVPNLPIFEEDPHRLFNIAPNDVVTVNEAATVEYHARRASDEARMRTAAERQAQRVDSTTHRTQGLGGSQRGAPTSLRSTTQLP